MEKRQADLKERLLAEYESPSLSPRQRSKQDRWLISFLSLFTTLLLFVSILLAFTARKFYFQRFDGPSKFTGLSHDTPLIYHSHSDWWGDNETLADELWDGLDVSPLTVALTDEFATEHGLTISESRFPWDDEKGLYFLKVFHQLHCLKIMRKAFVDIERGNHPIIIPKHVHHCLDALRQDVMCIADDTPMPTLIKEDHIGDNQVRQCRNINDLIAWTQHPDHSACYRRLTDYQGLYHKLERFAFCPEGSPYTWVVEAYFKRWGHHDPFSP